MPMPENEKNERTISDPAEKARVLLLQDLVSQFLTSGMSQMGRDEALAACADIQDGHASIRFETTFTPVTVRIWLVRRGADDRLMIEVRTGWTPTFVFAEVPDATKLN